MALFGLTKSSVTNQANGLGIKLAPDVYYSRVHEAARKYMITNNPMRNPVSLAKMKAHYRRNPMRWAAILDKLTAAKINVQKNKPTKLEKRLYELLELLEVHYEPFFLVKPYTIVDARLGNLIIQVDGDYWHGHPSLAPLSTRQLEQHKRDRRQDAHCTECGFTVVRIWDSQLTKRYLLDVLRYHGITPMVSSAMAPY